MKTNHLLFLIISSHASGINHCLPLLKYLAKNKTNKNYVIGSVRGGVRGKVIPYSNHLYDSDYYNLTLDVS